MVKQLFMLGCANLRCKGPDSKCSGLVQNTVPPGTTQICPCSVEAAMATM